MLKKLKDKMNTFNWKQRFIFGAVVLIGGMGLLVALVDLIDYFLF